MQYDLKAKAITLTPAIRAAVEKSMKMLDAKVKRFGASVTGEVEVMKSTRHHRKGDFFRAEIHVRLPGALIYAQAEMDDLYNAIVTARHEAEEQIAKYRGKRQDSRKRDGATKRT
jgi:ribosomal subunit interface protein